MIINYSLWDQSAKGEKTKKRLLKEDEKLYKDKGLISLYSSFHTVSIMKIQGLSWQDT